MSFLTPKVQLPAPPKKPPIETTVIRNPRNRAASGRRGGSNIQSILSAGLTGGTAGQTRLAGGV